MSGEQVLEYVCNLTTDAILIELKHVNVLYSVYTVVYAAYISRFNCINSAAVRATLKLPFFFYLCGKTVSGDNRRKCLLE